MNSTTVSNLGLLYLCLYHIAGETGTKHCIVEGCVFNRTMAAYSIFKFQNMNIQCYFTQKLRGFGLGNKKN